MTEDADDDAATVKSSFPALGIVAAAVLGFTLQPMIAIADPIALLVTGFLAVVTSAGFVLSTNRELTTKEDKIFGWALLFTLFAMVATVVDAWREQRSVDRICGNLQHVMLYEHRERKDVPEIFRSLQCNIQA